MNLKFSFPKLTEELLKKVEKTLAERFDFAKIPSEYGLFLLKNNGGFVSPGFIDDHENTKHTHEIVFKTPLKWATMDDKPVEPALIAFFGVWLENDMDEDEVEDWDLPELLLSNENSKEEFDILPDNMMSIASCQHPDASDLLCISLETEDFGAVYYYYGLCDHPSKGYGDHYEKATEVVLKKYGLNISDTDNLDSRNPSERKIIDDLKRVNFIKVANSLTEFLENCKLVETEKFD